MMLPGGVVDERSDVYLVGATLHTALVGRHRNPGGRTTEVLAHLCAPTRIDWPPTLPVELRQLIETATAWRKEERHVSVAALRADLQRFVNRRASYELTHQAEPACAELASRVASGPLPRRELSRRIGDLRAKLECALVIHPGNERARSLIDGLSELTRDRTDGRRGLRTWRFEAVGRARLSGSRAP